MIKKMGMVFLLICSFLFSSAETYAKQVQPPKPKKAELYDPEMNCTKNIKLTWAQKKQLGQIYHRIYMDYVALIEFYSWSGALPFDQKKLRYDMLRNYIKTFYIRNYRWCSEHESDEWEEEWYNNDQD